ncbi:alpha/beta fold hydrolase [Pseudomonas sp. P154a]|uniref:lipase family protein n=1 Tax=Pseudomonas mucoides TaxID=2730424 RepID=UPI00189263AE|nr:lipase family protein [Pseudomonas mucoides]MBF6037321.1 alpha/beta fold hydrolase [Pseudomonas mucoides]
MPHSIRLLSLAMLQASLLIAAASTSPQTLAATAPAVEVRAPDSFYDPPANPPAKPGVLLRSEPLAEASLPAGMRGWRIQYSTSVDDHTPATAVATVFAPTEMPAGPRPVITWEHGTTGLVQRCMPSLISVPTEGIPARDKIVKAGWVVVATDYSFTEKGGPHPYIIGEGEARAALDATRAARQMPELSLDERTVVWGHSQGGHSALWTGIVAPRYAPDVKVLGVVGIAPAANMKDILENNVAVNKRLGPYIAQAYSRFYPDVKFDQAIRPEARVAAHEIAGLCGFFPPQDPQRIQALTKTFEGPSLNLPADKALAARLEQNTANQPIPMPELIIQGLADPVVLPSITQRYVDERCKASQHLEYWTVAERDHGTIVRPGTPLEQPLMDWTQARFDGKAQAQGCSTKPL